SPGRWHHKNARHVVPAQIFRPGISSTAISRINRIWCDANRRRSGRGCGRPGSIELEQHASHFFSVHGDRAGARHLDGHALILAKVRFAAASDGFSVRSCAKRNNLIVDFLEYLGPVQRQGINVVGARTWAERSLAERSFLEANFDLLDFAGRVRLRYRLALRRSEDRMRLSNEKAAKKKNSQITH